MKREQSTVELEGTAVLFGLQNSSAVSGAPVAFLARDMLGREQMDGHANCLKAGLTSFRTDRSIGVRRTYYILCKVSVCLITRDIF